jgi:hypothetical protein
MGLFKISADSIKKYVNMVPLHMRMCIKTMQFKTDMIYDGESVRKEKVDMKPFAEHVSEMSYDRVMDELKRLKVIK